MFKAQERSVLSTSPYGIPSEFESLMLLEARQRGEILVRTIVTPLDQKSSSKIKMNRVLSELEKILPVVSTISSKTELFSAEAVFLVSPDYHYARSMVRRTAAGFHVTVDEVAWETYGAVKYETIHEFDRELAKNTVLRWKEELISLFIRSKTAQAAFASGTGMGNATKSGTGVHCPVTGDSPSVTLVLFRRKGQVFAIPEYAVRKISKFKSGGFVVSISLEESSGIENLMIAADSFVARRSVLLAEFFVKKTARGFSVAAGEDWVTFIPPFRNR